MSETNFLQKVVRMRSLQKEYFKTKNPLLLREAMDSEKAVDSAIKELLIQDGQKNLFEKEKEIENV